MSKFRPFDRETPYLLPPSLDEWLPQKHLARFVAEVIDGLDLSALSRSYRGTGSASYHPALLLGVLVYGYATGVFSSRKLERATYDSVAFRFIAANEHPDHDTIAAFRRRFLPQIEASFVQVLLLAREMGLLKLGTVGLDGTKIHANASRHSALSYEHAGKLEAQLKAEVADLMAKAEAADQADVPDGMSIPDELARREERLSRLAEARAKIEARARERFKREQADHEARLAQRAAKAAATGKKPAGREPKPPVAAPLTPQDTAQLQRFAGYLNGIRTMTAKFQQVASNGAVSSGRLWVSRPGRMRFEYDRPNTLALLADAGFVYQWDKELQQTTKIELRSTPAWFFLRDTINFGPDIVVTRYEQGGGTIRATVVEAEKPDLGSLTLVFTENPLTLRQWTVVDQQGRRTTVSLSDLQLGVALDPRLFQYQYLFSPPTQ